MRTALVGVIGHVDHGKTALVKALTGVETDRLAEEKRRGMSIELGFALLSAADAEIDLVDMPGHERLVRTMAAGASGMDAVLLVVDARDGIMPQTLEHVEIARLLGIRRGAVALSKCDACDREQAGRAEREVMRLLDERGLEPMPVVQTSAFTGAGIERLSACLLDLARPAGGQADGGLFHLPIDRAFTRPGAGTVVTGTLRRGRLRVGDEVAIVPGDHRARVRGLHSHGRPVSTAEPGRRIAVALRGRELAKAARGVALAAPGAMEPSRWLDVVLEPALGPPALRSGDRVRLLAGTSDTTARVRLLDRDELQGPGLALAQLHCEQEIATLARERFILRRDTPAATVAGGFVLDPVSARRRRHCPAEIERLSLLAAAEGQDLAAALLRLNGRSGMPVAMLARLTSSVPGRFASWLPPEVAVPAGADHVVSRSAWLDLRHAAVEAIAAHQRQHPLGDGMRKDQLMQSLTPAPAAIVDALLCELVGECALVVAGGIYRRASRAGLGDLSAQHAALLGGVEGAFRSAGLRPPPMAEIAGTCGQRRAAIDLLLRRGVLVRLTERVHGYSIIFHRDAIRSAVERLQESCAGEPFRAGEAGAALGISRRFCIPLLEHLDTIGATRRTGDRRVLAAHDIAIRTEPERSG